MNHLKTKNYIPIIAFIIASYSLKAQIHSQKIVSSDFNKRYIEHLIKIKIDSVRQVNNCSPLINDSILFVASNHHAQFMREHKKMSHYEYGFKITETPQLRANYYGAQNYGVGENVLKAYCNTLIETKRKKVINTSTYSGLANAIVDGWVNSPGHFKNMITPDYQITGVSVSIDTTTNAIYACQKFAKVLYKYSFRESKSLFTYSNYTPSELTDSFEGIESKLKAHGHNWGVKHNELVKCNRCSTIVNFKPPITLSHNNGSFILKIENSDYVKQLIQNKWDGFAVEIVEFNDYMCGNPEYYTRSSRRNGQCKLNGKTLHPLYRKDLYKGYKKRKRNKSITFLSYIFNTDSVPFFDRFARYKIEKYSSEYFEIKLGKLPKDVTGLWNHNLVYLQDKQLCHIDYFTSYCGELYMDYKSTDFIAPDTIVDYSFKLDTLHHTFTVPFEKNHYDFNYSDISPFIESLSGLDYTIDSIHIKAFSSIEGDSTVNVNLQNKRAASIIKILEENQSQHIATKIETSMAWAQFYHELKSYPQWLPLSKLKRDTLKQLVDRDYTDSLEFILQKGRKGIINLHGTIDLTDNNLKYYIEKENKWICDTLNKLPVQSEGHKAFLKRYSKFYKFVYKNVIAQKVDTSLLTNLSLPVTFNFNPKLSEQFILYGYQFQKEFLKNGIWISTKDRLSRSLLNKYLYHLSDEFIYNDCRIKVNKLNNKKVILQKNIQNILNEMNLLSSFYNHSEIAAENIERLSFDLNMLLINRCFMNKPKEKSEEALFAIYQIQSFYEKYESMNSCLALSLAKLLVYYNNNGTALSTLSPYMDEDFILSYAIPLYYRHSSSESSKNFYDWLINLSKQMETDTWCNLFLSKCNIPFQAFDHEQLRDIFCAKCMDKNKMIKSLTGD